MRNSSLVELSLIHIFGVVAGLSALVIHLAGIESFGVSYLTPFASNAGEQVEGHAVFRQPLPQVKPVSYTHLSRLAKSTAASKTRVCS